MRGHITRGGHFAPLSPISIISITCTVHTKQMEHCSGNFDQGTINGWLTNVFIEVSVLSRQQFLEMSRSFNITKACQ